MSIMMIFPKSIPYSRPTCLFFFNWLVSGVKNVNISYVALYLLINTLWPPSPNFGGKLKIHYISLELQIQALFRETP